jgi:hypothetical protein
MIATNHPNVLATTKSWPLFGSWNRRKVKGFWRELGACAFFDQSYRQELPSASDTDLGGPDCGGGWSCVTFIEMFSTATNAY